MLQRVCGLLFGAMLAFPAQAQDAGPLELAPGMRAYTTRVFVAPEVLAGLSVGDEVSIYSTFFTAWDYPNAEGFQDTYVVARSVQNVQILAIGALTWLPKEIPLMEVPVRLSVSLDDVAQLVSASRSEIVERDSSIIVFGQIEENFVRILDSAGMLVMVANPDDIPVFCEACETVLLRDYYNRDINRTPACYRTERRGVEVTRIEVPCRDD